MLSSTHSPSQSAPTILVLKTWVGLWPWKKQGEKKQGHCYSKREEAAWSLLLLNKEWPCFFLAWFLQKAGCPVFKKQGARFLRIVGADWLGECVCGWVGQKRSKNVLTYYVDGPKLFLGFFLTTRSRSRCRVSFSLSLFRPFFLLLFVLNHAAKNVEKTLVWPT